MMSNLPPGAFLILGSILLLLARGLTSRVLLLGLPLLSFWHLLSLPVGHFVELSCLGYTLTPIRVDKLSLVWGYVYHIATGLSALYALHVKDTTQHVAAFVYAGSAIAAAFAGDWITLFVFWELTAVSSVFLIWATRTRRSYRVGMRYLIIQVASGVLLMAGILIHVSSAGSLNFEQMGTESFAGKVILLAFGIKCAFPFLHNWLQDAYPESTVTGAVFLSAFTTKLAIYALARAFPGTEILIPIGAAMTLFPIFYAVIENDLRRVLAYSLNNQLGFMVVGIGVGTELALNGAAAHAFAHIIYKGLLFMAMGAVLYRTGTIRATELGGLYRSMPWTTAFCIIGSLSISGFPLFSGFVTKAMTLTAAAETHVVWLSLALLVASAGVVDHSGIKIPFFAFFAQDSGRRVEEAPANMLLAMGGMAFLCIAIGLYPTALYAILPYAVDYAPYTTAHVITSLQLLLFAALAFCVLWRFHAHPGGGLLHLFKYPPELPSINLDTDWSYRRAIPWLGQRVGRPLLGTFAFLRDATYEFGEQTAAKARALGSPARPIGEPWPPGLSALWILAVLGLCLLGVYSRI